MSRFADAFEFPVVVNENAARLVAAFVLLLSLAYMLSGNVLILAILSLGFALRVLFGPKYSPLARLVTRVIVPRLGVKDRPTAGAPKRFAQGVGFIFSFAALLLHTYVGTLPAMIVMGILSFCAMLESVLAYCLGCKVYGFMMHLGWIDPAVCVDCVPTSMPIERSPHLGLWPKES